MSSTTTDTSICMQLFDPNHPPTLRGSFDNPPNVDDSSKVVSKDIVDATLEPGWKWQNGTVLSVGFLAGPSTWATKVQEYCVEWSQYANITFTFPAAGPYEIRIAFNTTNTSNSYVGTQNLSITDQTLPTMNLPQLDDIAMFRRKVLHEFGHVLGLIHEQFNPAANIQWDKAAVYADCVPPWTEEQVDANFFAVYPGTEHSAVWDPLSIMEYPILPGWTTNDTTVVLALDLSQEDKNFIAVQYPTVTADFKAPLNAKVDAPCGPGSVRLPFEGTPKVAVV